MSGPGRQLQCLGGPADGKLYATSLGSGCLYVLEAPKVSFNLEDTVPPFLEVRKHRYIARQIACGKDRTWFWIHDGVEDNTPRRRETGKTPGEETVMQTYRFEIVAPRVTDGVTGKETKPAIRIAHGEGLLEKPNEADLLQDAGEALTKAGRKASEASVNIRPFCG